MKDSKTDTQHIAKKFDERFSNLDVATLSKRLEDLGNDIGKFYEEPNYAAPRIPTVSPKSDTD